MIHHLMIFEDGPYLDLSRMIRDLPSWGVRSANGEQAYSSADSSTKAGAAGPSGRRPERICVLSSKPDSSRRTPRNGLDKVVMTPRGPIPVRVNAEAEPGQSDRSITFLP